MRLAFVSRARYGLLQHNYDELRKDLHAAHDGLNAVMGENEQLVSLLAKGEERYDKLFEKFCAIKLAGGELPEVLNRAPKKEADPVTQLINTMSAGRPGLRAQMMRQLALDRANPLIDDVEIMRKIEMGVVEDSGVPA